MIEQEPPKAARRKTPSDASEFEREQLRFLLSGDNVATTLATVNPSLSWLPLLFEMQVIQGDGQLIAWIERNFGDVHAVRDVVANIHFFGPETANFLEFRLNRRAADLPPLLATCWRLILRQMKEAKRGYVQNDWFEIAPRVSQGEHSVEVLERIAEALRPKVKIGKRLALYDQSREPPERPSDLMSVDFEVEGDLSADDLLERWPEDASAEIDDRLLSHLTVELEAALADATDVGVEAYEGYSTSDSDVPSVANHDQNRHRSGFHALVRVMAELWLRLAMKSPLLALDLVKRWRNSKFRLTRRLALFACADPAVPPDTAADVLIEVPIGELFLTNSSVEVYRLIRMRWQELPHEKQQVILRRLCGGPPRGWFREDADIDRAISRSRFDFLAEMQRDGFDIGEEAEGVLKNIREEWPEWTLRPAEQAGFHIWHGSVHGIVGNAAKLQAVPDDELVTQARKIIAAANFLDGDAWHALCLTDPDRAVRGLDDAAAGGDWPVELWRQLLWAHKVYAVVDTESRIAQLLMQWPVDSFHEIASPASSWLEEHAKSLEDPLLWPLWDRIADAILIENSEANDE